MFRRIWPTIEELNVKQPVDMAVLQGLRGCTVGGAIVLQAGSLRVRLQPSGRTVVFGSTQPLTEMNTKGIS